MCTGAATAVPRCTVEGLVAHTRQAAGHDCMDGCMAVRLYGCMAKRGSKGRCVWEVNGIARRDPLIAPPSRCLLWVFWRALITA